MQRTRISKGVSKVKWNARRQQHFQTSFTPNGGGNKNYSKGFAIGLVIVLVIIALIILL